MKLPQRRMPAEWERHHAILLSFPHNGKDWPGKFDAVKWALVDFIKKIIQFETLILLVKNDNHLITVKNLLDRHHVDQSHIQFIHQETDRSWMRDSGPIIVKRNDGTSEALKFKFNAWAKYSNYKKDQLVPNVVAAYLKIPLTEIRHRSRHIILEGGAIDVNGRGTLLTTEECLLDPKIQVRNKHFSKENYEAVFREYLGISNVIWLKKGIVGDDTHGHVDDICRFINPTTVVACVEDNVKDPNYSILQENLKILKNAKLENGSPLNVVEIPMPKPVYFEDMRLPVSYANFLIINHAVFFPTFNDENDKRTYLIFQTIFPGREIMGIHALDLVWGLGTLHCLSHEIPV